MRIAKLFLGPQDGLQVKVQGMIPDELTIIRSAETDDPEDLLLDVYVYVPDWCANPHCQFLHYDYVNTERTVEE